MQAHIMQTQTQTKMQTPKMAGMQMQTLCRSLYTLNPNSKRLIAYLLRNKWRLLTMRTEQFNLALLGCRNGVQCWLKSIRCQIWYLTRRNTKKPGILKIRWNAQNVSCSRHRKLSTGFRTFNLKNYIHKLWTVQWIFVRVAIRNYETSQWYVFYVWKLLKFCVDTLSFIFYGYLYSKKKQF